MTTIATEVLLSNTALLAIPANEVLVPKIQVATYVQEAFDLEVWIAGDHEALVHAGLPQKLITELPIRAEMLARAQSLWVVEQRQQELGRQAFRQRMDEAEHLRRELKADFREAFRKHPNLNAKVTQMTSGRSQSGLIQNLSDLSVLGAANIPLLKAINFDPIKLKQATAWPDELAMLLAKMTHTKLSKNEVKQIRDRAYTHLKEAVDEIIAKGKFVFRHQPERRRGYKGVSHQRQSDHHQAQSY